MGNKRLLRYGLGTMTLAAAAAGLVLVACGDDDSNGTTPGVDSGTDTGTGEETGTVDSGTDADAGPTIPNAKLQLVNAATDFGPNNASGGLRVCYGVGASEATAVVAPLPPLPDRASPGAPFAGVFIGTGGSVQGTGIDLGNLAVVPYIMNAQSLALKGLTKPAEGNPGTSCDAMLKADFDAGGGPLVEGVDYWKLPAIPAGTLVKGKSFVLVLSGCTGDATADPAKCGPGATLDGGANAGNLSVKVFEVDRATKIDADKVGTQFIHAAPASVPALTSLAQGVQPGYTSDPGDAGAFKNVSNNQPVAVLDKTALVQIPGVNPATDSFALNPVFGAVSLSNVVLATYGAAPPADGSGAVKNGAAYTFLAVGDATEPQQIDGGFNTRTFHFLGFRNDPPVETYKP